MNNNVGDKEENKKKLCSNDDGVKRGQSGFIYLFLQYSIKNFFNLMFI